MNFHSRLRRLEAGAASAGASRPCPACGGPLNWRSWKPDPGPIRVVVEPETIDPPIPDRCPECGRTLIFRVEFDSGG